MAESDRDSDKPAFSAAALPPDSLVGGNHPLAMPASAAQGGGAVEIVAGAGSQDTQKPLSKLDAGDHTIQLPDGRQFMVHVPKTDATNPPATLPAMFVFTGSGEPQWNIKDFAPETGMSAVADEDPKHPFVVVYALPEKHLIGTGSSQAAFGWNSTGSLIDEADRKNAGYDDIDYVKSIANLMPQLANVDSSHKDWGAVGFSQGGIFLNKVLATVPNLFPSADLVGTSMQKGYKYDAQPGNARNVSIVELLGDKTTLPMRGWSSESWTYKKDNIERFLLHDVKIGGFNGKNYLESDDPLAAIQNENQKPQLENKLYLGRLGKQGKDYTAVTTDLNTPVASTKKDFEIDYKPKDPNDDRRVTVVGLVEAQHSYPAPLYGPRTNATLKYTEFDASRQFAKLFDQYNDQVHSKDALAGKPTNAPH
jgi:poly(3-hydroxybutyrate) depolymerase